MTICHYFIEAAEKYPERLFLRHISADGTQADLSYNDALLRVAGIVAKLKELGFGSGHRIACYCEDTPQLMFFQLACGMLGVAPVPISPLFSPRFLKTEVADRIGADSVFTTPELVPHLLPHGLKALSAGESLDGNGSNAEWLPSTLGSTPANARSVLIQAGALDIGHDDLFVIQPTSGSTGFPKLVLRKHRGFTRYAESLAQRLDPRPEGEPDRFLMIGSLTHAFGLHMLTTALKLGAEMCVPRGLDKDSWVEDIEGHAPTVLPLLPRVQRAFKKRHHASGRQRFFPRTTRYVLSAGGPSSPDLVEWIQGEGVEYVEFYGSSEASMGALTTREGWRARCAGKLLDDVEAKLAEDGELLLRSPGLFLGYLGDQEATRAAFTKDGFYRTGDFAEIDNEGYLRILGRKRHVYHTPEGSYLHPKRIELLIEGLPWVKQALVAGDGQAYITALIVVCEDELGEFAGGFLDPEAHQNLYERCGAALSEVNAHLEKVEQIVRFVLFAGVFDPQVYAVLGSGKIKRNRAAIGRCYETQVAILYDSIVPPHPTFVPGADPRLRSDSPTKNWPRAQLGSSSPSESPNAPASDPLPIVPGNANEVRSVGGPGPR
jgi:long-chain acyl-CoA synthetase